MAEVMDAIERLRERAQNEATCIELSRQNKLLRARVARLEEFVKKVELAFDEIGAVNWSRRARRALEEK